MNAGGAGFDHALHQLERVQRPAEAGLGVGHDRREPVALAWPFPFPFPFRAVPVRGTPSWLRCSIWSARSSAWLMRRTTLGTLFAGIEALVGVDLPREVRVGRHLPAAEVDRLEARLHLLHRLVAGERAERVHVIALGQQVPEPPRAQVRQRVLDRARCPRSRSTSSPR